MTGSAAAFHRFPGVKYSRENIPGPNEDVGWSLKFNEKA
jgi:hypothetical protein